MIKIKNAFSNKIHHFSPAQLIFTFYLVAVVVAVSLLSLPVARQEGADWSFINALFTAVSAVSVTGLTTVSIVDTFTVPGIIILAFVLQFGGVGVMAVGTFIWLLLGRKIGLKERRLMMIDQNQSNLSGIVKMIKQILILILTIEIIGALTLGTYFLSYYPTWQEAYLHGFFASVSATTNGGFDITGESLVPFAKDYFVQFITMILIITGAIGFPVLVEVKEFITHKGGRFRFSLFTKITTITFACLITFGTVAILLLEFSRFFKDMSWHESFFYALFQSVTTRSGGLATMDVSEFTLPTLLIMSGLMFIGASPSSVGGGIRTTTFALNILFLYHFARGNKSIKLFRREIHEEDLIKSLVVLLLAIFICSSAVIILTITEPFTMIQILFEVCSAFGTTGLSMGITPDLSTIGKCVIMCLMFIGRVGLLTFLFILESRQKPPKYHYPVERVIIG
ncbi:Trk-type K+ transport system membrane component [Bacillus tianshenii]|uniref:Trk-type K+ transport system membrane component n=1 Tax=Sutcliffiella tianshenii TaxID=1463404 RepID=A0ABS2P5S2_9BACI|nr:TrkH family potassium uptake protein [Bacillus tianshenii]MBM7622234.1 Trk-type K+ transport system membrane component [Bacillus tianshenii]MCA1319276.1 TrkH family potassium uptake protein [Bacillus tianshenii]